MVAVFPFVRVKVLALGTLRYLITRIAVVTTRRSPEGRSAVISTA